MSKPRATPKNRHGHRATTILRASARQTNLTLLLVLSLAFGTGIGAMATGSANGRWTVIAHGGVAIMVMLLVPWKRSDPARASPS